MGTILCYGDSNTWGFDSRSYFGEQYPETVCWTNVLAQKSGWAVQNHGMNGREIPCTPFTISEVKQLAEQNAAARPPVWLWVMLGSNDLLNGADMRAEDVAERMEHFLRELRLSPVFMENKVHLRLIAPPPMQAGTWTNDRVIAESHRLGIFYAKLAEQLGVAFTDVGEVPLLYDGVHFTEQGHLLFAERMFGVINSEK